MLTPDARTVLLDDLKAPPGFDVDAAVATTFTLDLTAAMLPPFSFADIGVGTSRTDPITVLQALRHASDKVDIFCQAGSISVPRSPDLVAFLEPMVHQVVPPPGTLFHPKTWVLRFVAPDAPPRYRLLVLSRNLTHDNTWDVAVRLDSESLAEAPDEQNGPLAALLRWLPEHSLHIGTARRERVLSLADEITHVRWEHPEDVERITFHAGGVPGQAVVDLRAGRHLVISPFVTPSGLDLGFTGRQDSPILLSRQEELDELPAEALDGVTAYTLAADTAMPTTDDAAIQSDDDVVETGSHSELTPQPSGTLSGLHAKVFVLEPTDRWSKARVLMGSSNATVPGLTQNVEFLVEVLGRRDRLGIEQVLPPDHLSTGGIRPLVEPYARQAPVDRELEKVRRQLQQDLRSIAAINHVIDIHPESDSSPTTYTATVTADKPYRVREGVSVDITLITRPGVSAHVKGAPHLTVSSLEAAHVTPCIAVTATHGDISESTVILGHLIGSPEGRLDAVIASQVNDKDKFRRLLLLLLSLGNPADLAALLAGDATGDGTAAPFGVGTNGVLELVLRGLGTRSPAIGDLDRIMGALDPEVFPDGFERFWQQVRSARDLVEEA